MRRSPWLYASLVLVYVILLGPYLIIFVAAFGSKRRWPFRRRASRCAGFANVFETSQFVSSFWLSLQIGTAVDLDRAAVGGADRLCAGAFSLSWPRDCRDESSRRRSSCRDW